MICLTPGLRRSSGSIRRRLHGFTLLELLAVVSIIAILVSLLCAALNHTRDKALRLSCFNNMKQLQTAWGMYVDDHDMFLPLNQSAPAPKNHHRIFSSWLTSTNSWVAGNPILDTDTFNLRRGKLFPYLGSTEVYRCRQDSATVTGHPDIPRTRSYSMNAFLGGDPGDPRVKFKLTELVNPRPDKTFVFIEEHEESRWAANFVVPPREFSLGLSQWVSTPSDRHYQGCNLTFADGHVEFWRWYTSKVPSEQDNRLASSGREIRDLRRLQACVPELRD